MATVWGLRAVSQKAEHWDFDLYFGFILTSTKTTNMQKSLGAD